MLSLEHHRRCFVDGRTGDGRRGTCIASPAGLEVMLDHGQVVGSDYNALTGQGQAIHHPYTTAGLVGMLVKYVRWRLWLLYPLCIPTCRFSFCCLVDTQDRGELPDAERGGERCQSGSASALADGITSGRPAGITASGRSYIPALGP